MRVLKKCFNFSQKYPILLMPKRDPYSTFKETSIFNTVLENDLIW